MLPSTTSSALLRTKSLFSMEAQGGLLAPVFVLREDLSLKALTLQTDPASSGLEEKKQLLLAPLHIKLLYLK